MESKGGGKIKEKRTHLSSKPYQRRKSLFGKVTDTMKELLAPSWLSDFVSSVKQKPHSEADDITEEEEDEDEEFMSPAQSPSELADLPRKNVHLSSKPAQLILPGNGISHSLKTDSGYFPASRLKFPIEVDSTFQVEDNPSEKDQSCFTSDCAAIPRLSDRLVAGKNMLTLANLNFHKDNVQFSQTNENFTQTLTSGNIQKQTKTVVLPKDEGLVQGPGPGYLPDQLERIKTWSANVNDTLSHVNTSSRNTQNKPAFNISLFGSPLNNTTLLTESFHESSFYPGKTTFGGSSAHKKTTLPYQTALPTRKPMKVKQLNQTVAAVTSSTAKRILDTLERMSTPLTDAKKIPNSSCSRRDSFLSFTPSKYGRQTRYSLGSSVKRSADFPSRGPPVSKLNTTSFASISKNRQSVSTFDGGLSFTEKEKKRKLEQTTSKENPVKSDRLTAYDNPPVGGKMKREKSYHNPSMKAEDDVIIVPDLDTSFTLPVKDMPKFSFGSSIAQATTSGSFSTVPDRFCPDARFTFSSPLPTTSNAEHSSSITLKSDYKFSSPIRLDDECGEPVSKIPNTRNSTDSGMRFGIHNVAPRPKLSSVSPHSVDGQKTRKQPTVMIVDAASNQNSPLQSFQSGNVLTMIGGNGNSSSLQGLKSVSDPNTGSMVGVFNRNSESGNNASFSEGVNAASDLVRGSIMDVLSKNQNHLPSIGSRTASELKMGSVMDVLGKRKHDSLSSGLNTASELKSGSVMDVLSKSKESTDTLGGFKAAQELKQGSVMDILGKGKNILGAESSCEPNELMVKFTPPVGSWTCDVCLVQNKPDVQKCAACQTGKPDAKPQQSNDLKSMFGKPSGTWTCDTCLVPNEASDTKCVACQTTKSDASAVRSDFKSSKFAPPVGSWTCDVCLISNKVDLHKCAACRSSKPGSKLKFKKPEGEWNCDTCLVHNNSGAVKCIACETPRPGTQPSATGAFKVPSHAFSMSSGFTQGAFQFVPSSSDNQPSTAFTSSVFTKQTLDSKASDTPVTGFVFETREMDKKSDSASGFKFEQQEKPLESKTSNAPVSEFVLGKGEENKISDSTSCFKLGQQETTEKSDSDSKDKTSLGFVFRPQTEIKTNSAILTPFSFGNNKNDATEKSTSNNPIVTQIEHVTNSNSITVSKPEPTSAVSFSCVAQTSSVPSTTTFVPGGLDFSVGQNMQPSIFQTPSAGLTSSVNSSESALKPQMSMFGATDLNKPSLGFGTSESKPSLDTTKPIFGTSTADTSKTPFVFGQGANAPSSNQTAQASAGGFNFTPAAPLSKPVETSNCGLFVFGGQSNNKDNKPLGAAPSVITTTAALTFGIASAKSSTTPVFGSSTNPPAFSLPSTTSIQSFGTSAASTPGFSTTFMGQQATPTQTAPFGATKTEAATPFGVGSVATPAVRNGGSVFGISPFGTTPTPTFSSTSAPVFGGANTGGSCFGQNSTTPAFGATASAPLYGFGGGSGTASAFVTSTSSAGNPDFNFSSNPNFNFGAGNNTAQANIFQFGAQPTPGSTAPSAQPQQPAPATAGFNFGQAAANPGQGTFNFNATSTPVDQVQRKIKRAVRKIKRT